MIRNLQTINYFSRLIVNISIFVFAGFQMLVFLEKIIVHLALFSQKMLELPQQLLLMGSSRQSNKWSREAHQLENSVLQQNKITLKQFLGKKQDLLLHQVHSNYKSQILFYCIAALGYQECVFLLIFLFLLQWVFHDLPGRRLLLAIVFGRKAAENQAQNVLWQRLASNFSPLDPFGFAEDLLVFFFEVVEKNTDIQIMQALKTHSLQFLICRSFAQLLCLPDPLLSTYHLNNMKTLSVLMVNTEKIDYQDWINNIKGGSI